MMISLRTRHLMVRDIYNIIDCEELNLNEKIDVMKYQEDWDEVENEDKVDIAVRSILNENTISQI